MKHANKRQRLTVLATLLHLKGTYQDCRKATNIPPCTLSQIVTGALVPEYLSAKRRERLAVYLGLLPHELQELFKESSSNEINA